MQSLSTYKVDTYPGHFGDFVSYFQLKIDGTFANIYLLRDCNKICLV